MVINVKIWMDIICFQITFSFFLKEKIASFCLYFQYIFLQRSLGTMIMRIQLMHFSTNVSPVNVVSWWLCFAVLQNMKQHNIVYTCVHMKDSEESLKNSEQFCITYLSNCGRKSGYFPPFGYLSKEMQTVYLFLLITEIEV